MLQQATRSGSLTDQQASGRQCGSLTYSQPSLGIAPVLSGCLVKWVLVLLNLPQGGQGWVLADWGSVAVSVFARERCCLFGSHHSEGALQRAVEHSGP